MRSQCGGLRARAGSQPGADSALTPRHAPCASVLLADRRGGRRFRQFRYRTHSSWSRKRRVIGKAEHLRQGANPRFVVTNLELSEIQSPQRLYEQVYCARGEMENRIKEQQLCLFADRTSSAKPTVIMDAGIATEENLTWLRQQHYNWICVSREGKPQPPEGVAELTLTTSAGQQVQVWKLASKDDEARLYAVSAGKKITANAILKKNRQQFEAALQHLHDGLSKPGFLKNYDRVQQSIGRIMQRYPKVSRQYDVRVTKDATTKGSATRGVGTKASTVTFSRKQQYDDAAAGIGSYVLRTSHSDWNLERILRAYWRLTEIEATFRSLWHSLALARAMPAKLLGTGPGL